MRIAALALACLAGCSTVPEAPLPPNARRPANDADLRSWLENMVAYHRFTSEEVTAATGLGVEEQGAALLRFGIESGKPPSRKPGAPLTVLPYPGGRHPRTGFLDGALDPQRETKISVFTPWDPLSYVVVDVPEAIFTNLGLTYLAHRHVPTIWTKQGIELKPVEWVRGTDGSLRMTRTLPNGISFGTIVTPGPDRVDMELWLHNGTGAPLTNMRVQNCVLFRGAAGFEAQTKDNKTMVDGHAACVSADGRRWIVTKWAPLHRTWANPPCPCMHSDPTIPDCPPGKVRSIRGWLSFHEGGTLQEATAAGAPKDSPRDPVVVRGTVRDEKGLPVPCRLYVSDASGKHRVVGSDSPTPVPYVKERSGSSEIHTTICGSFFVELPPGLYSFTAERGKEYLTESVPLEVRPGCAPFEIRLRRWIDATKRGWYSGETHVHREIKDLPLLQRAEDLNVAFPLPYWVTKSGMAPARGDKSAKEDPPAAPVEIDKTHVYYPRNTEYEIFSVGGKSHTLGAVFVLNHRSILEEGVPPLRPMLEKIRSEGALLELDKHNWPWSMALVPLLNVDLYELANNHMWRSPFAFQNFAEKAADYMKVETDAKGFTERGWIDFGFENYYALLNCGFRLRPTAGSASGVHPVPLGFGRVYVHLAEGFSYDAWVRGLNAGRSFVTTGPMLYATVNQHDPGGVSRGPGTYWVGGTFASPFPPGPIEILVNGEVVRRARILPRICLSGSDITGYEAYERKFMEELTLDGSSWIAVRAFEDRPDKRPRFAHTAPWYVEVEGKPLRPRKAEVEYLVRRVEAEIARSEGVLPAAAIEEYRAALGVYKKIAQTAR